MEVRYRSRRQPCLCGADGEGSWKSKTAGRLRAWRSKGATSSLKMDVVVNEDYARGCKEKKKDKYRVAIIREVELRAGGRA